MDNNIKHSKAPWVQDRFYPSCERDNVNECTIYSDDGEIIAHVYQSIKSNKSKMEGHANARLFAAAPDLLKALKEMMALYEDILKSNNIGKMCFQNYARLNEAPSLTRQAIAKAEGKSGD